MPKVAQNVTQQAYEVSIMQRKTPHKIWGCGLLHYSKSNCKMIPHLPTPSSRLNPESVGIRILLAKNYMHIGL